MNVIEKVSIIDQAVERLKKYIQSPSVKIGDQMPTESQLCLMLGVGRSTIREAMRTLKALQCVDIIPGKGTFVRRKTAVDDFSVVNWLSDNKARLDELMIVRRKLEVLAIELAIDHATDNDIGQIKEAFEHYLDASVRQSATDATYYDELFHHQIFCASHNQLLISIGKQISTLFREYRLKTFQVPASIENALYYHTKIYHSLVNRDKATSIAEMEKHLDFSMDDIIHLISENT